MPFTLSMHGISITAASSLESIEILARLVCLEEAVVTVWQAVIPPPCLQLVSVLHHMDVGGIHIALCQALSWIPDSFGAH